MPTPAQTRTGFLLAILSSATFGILPIFGKLAFAEGFEVPTLMAWRFSLGSLVLWGLLLLRSSKGTGGVVLPGGKGGGAGGAVSRLTIGLRRRFALLGLGALYSVNSALYFLALERIPATATSLIFYIYPAIVALLGITLLRQKVRPLKLTALALALAGVILTVGFARGRLDPAGVAMALASAAIVAFYLILGELALAGVPMIHATALVLTGTTLAFLGWEMATGGLGLPPTPRGWLLVVLMATVSTALSIVAMLGSIQRLGAGTTAIIQTLEPAITAGLAAVILEESLAARQYAGGALILLGVVLLRLAAPRHEPVPV